MREAMPEAMQVFIAPPTLEALRARLVGRGTDSPVGTGARLRDGARGTRGADEFGHVVVNDRLEDAVGELGDHLFAGTSPDAERSIRAPRRTLP